VIQKRQTVKVLMSAAAGALVLASLAGCGRVTARIDDWSPKDPGAPIRVEAGKAATLSLTFTNTGNRTGSFLARAVVRDSANVLVVIPPQTVTVAAGRQHTVSWEHIVASPGTYSVQFILGKDATTTYAQAPAAPAQLIVGVPAVASTKFRIGDRVRVTDAVRVRTGPGTENAQVSHVNYRDSAPAGVQGKVIGGPERAGEWVWWRVEFDAGYTGWSIENNLAKVAGG